MVYGFLDDGDYTISGYRLKITRSPEELGYSRFNSKGELITSARLSGSLTLSFVPLEPASGPASGMIECIYLRFSKPVIVDSNDKTVVTAVAPIDYGIIAWSRDQRSYSLVDSFPETSVPYKLALYGPPTQGVLCRFFNVDPERPHGPGLAPIRIKIINETGSVARVSSVVIPLDSVNIFYKPGTWVAMMSNVTMILESNSIASIHPDSEPLSADFEKSPDIVRGGISPIGYVAERKLFKMIWGY